MRRFYDYLCRNCGKLTEEFRDSSERDTPALCPCGGVRVYVLTQAPGMTVKKATSGKWAMRRSAYWDEVQRKANLEHDSNNRANFKRDIQKAIDTARPPTDADMARREEAVRALKNAKGNVVTTPMVTSP